VLDLRFQRAAGPSLRVWRRTLEIVTDAGLTGKNMRRPALADALDRLEVKPTCWSPRSSTG